MLVMFECTVVAQRLKNLRELRSLQTPKQALMVYRQGKWDRLPGDALLPGDLISIGRPAGLCNLTLPKLPLPLVILHRPAKVLPEGSVMMCRIHLCGVFQGALCSRDRVTYSLWCFWRVIILK